MKANHNSQIARFGRRVIALACLIPGIFNCANDTLSQEESLAILLGISEAYNSYSWERHGRLVDPWTRHALPKSNIKLEDVEFIDGYFYVLGEHGKMYRSMDGRSWEKIELPTTTTLKRIAKVNSTYLLVGHDGFVATSADGLTWADTYPLGPGYHFRDIITDGNATALLTGHSICATDNLTSFDCKSFLYPHSTGTVIPTNGRFVIPSNQWLFLECTEDCHIAANYTSANFSYWAASFYSPYSWYKYHAVATNSKGDSVLVGDWGRGTWTNSDWDSFAPIFDTGHGPGELKDIVFDGTNFVAVGDNGSVTRNSSTSANGWITRNSGFRFDLEKVAYGNGMYMAFGGWSRSTVITHPKF